MTTTTSDPEMLTTERSAELLSGVRAEIGRIIVGQQRVVERVLVALLAEGHCLLEGAPGLGKTRLLTTLATAMGGSFNRIQFTPDLLPSDIVGTRIWRQEEGRFTVELGPVFANFVLTDEINRAPAKVQSALLEVMAEHQVSIGGDTYKVDRPFLVLATQNPIESEGVYQLPEAQRDRFLMKVPVDYPAGPHEEMEIVRRAAGDAVLPREVISLEDVKSLQATTRAIHVDPRVADYAVRLVLATREPARQGLDSLSPLIAFGASPRASIGLIEGARALALLRGRSAVEPQDIYDIAYDVLNHRLVMSFDAVADGVSVDEVLYHLLTTIPAPQHGTQAPRAYSAHGYSAAPTGPPRIPDASPVPSSAAAVESTDGLGAPPWTAGNGDTGGGGPGFSSYQESGDFPAQPIIPAASPIPPSASGGLTAARPYGVSGSTPGMFPGQADSPRGVSRHPDAAGDGQDLDGTNGADDTDVGDMPLPDKPPHDEPPAS